MQVFLVDQTWATWERSNMELLSILPPTPRNYMDEGMTTMRELTAMCSEAEGKILSSQQTKSEH